MDTPTIRIGSSPEPTVCDQVRLLAPAASGVSALETASKAIGNVGGFAIFVRSISIGLLY
jgi:hypothetical protein